MGRTGPIKGDVATDELPLPDKDEQLPDLRILTQHAQPSTTLIAYYLLAHSRTFL